MAWSWSKHALATQLDFLEMDFLPPRSRCGCFGGFAGKPVDDVGRMHPAWTPLQKFRGGPEKVQQSAITGEPGQAACFIKAVAKSKSRCSFRVGTGVVLAAQLEQRFGLVAPPIGSPR
jgi:hypothetical protein